MNFVCLRFCSCNNCITHGAGVILRGVPYSKMTTRQESYEAMMSCLTGSNNSKGYGHWNGSYLEVSSVTNGIATGSVKSSSDYSTVYTGKSISKYNTFILSGETGDVARLRYEVVNGKNRFFGIKGQNGNYNIENGYDIEKHATSAVVKFIKKVIAGDTEFANGEVLGKWDVNSVVSDTNGNGYNDPNNPHGALFKWAETGKGTIEKEASTTDDEIWAIYEPASDSPILGSITVQKIDPVYGTNPFGMSFAGCKFDVINKSENEVIIGSKHFKPGDVVCTITTDKKGHATTGKILPVGTYDVIETSGNPYYEVNEDFKATFSIEVESPDPNVTLGVYNEKEVRVKNPVHPGRVVIQKRDPQNKRLKGAKFALEWSKDGVNWTRVHKSNSNKYQMRYGGCSSAGLDSEGCLTVGDSGSIVFSGLWPTLYYRVVEVEAPDGYTLLSEPVVIDELDPDRCS